MKGKYWQDHLSTGHITVSGQNRCLKHLLPHSHSIIIKGRDREPDTELQLNIEYSSHCVSTGPSQGQHIDFDTIGHDHLIVDHRSVYRAFHQSRYKLSSLLPVIIKSLDQRQCLFTGHSNWLTLEGQQLGYPEGTVYEVYFNIRRQSLQALNLHIESAYIRDPAYQAGQPVNFKRYEKIKGWLLLLKKARNEPVRKPGR